MSLKRAPTSELNHDNWDDDNPEDHEDMGSFKIAPKDVIEKRVIRTAKRRSNISTGEAKTNVFSGFSGFNKTQPASFDFLAKLTNGSNDNNAAVSKTETSGTVTSGLFSSKPSTTGAGGGLFSLPTSTPSKSPFGSPTTQAKTESVFGIPPSNTGFGAFTASKVDSISNDSPFKLKSPNTSSDANTDSDKTTAKFDIPSSTANTTKSLFSSTSNSTPFKIPTHTASNVTTGTKADDSQKATETKPEEKKNEKKLQYYSKLKGLNESVLDWIKKHVEQTPLCILSPIFKDYETYLTEIQAEYEGTAKKEDKKTDEKKDSSEVKQDTVSKPVLSSTSSSSSTPPAFTSKSLFASQANVTTKSDETTKPANNMGNFSFGIGSSTSTSSTMSTSSAGFSFGTNVSSGTGTSSLFSLATSTTTTTSTTNGTPFSFGVGQPFSFSSKIKQNTETKEEANDEEDTPPKVEYNPIAEENSVYDKKCKIFVKKDGNFVDKGVGTLYIKKIDDSEKHQLLVRANTSLGTILVNLILASAIPTQRSGKNNVMMVCIPTPDAKPPPTPVLIRVKTSEEADELLETLDKYKS